MTARTAQRRLLNRNAKRANKNTAQANQLIIWAKEAQRRAILLDAPGVWRLYEEEKDRAETMKLLEDLKDIVFKAAASFANPSMAKLTRCHRRGRSDAPLPEEG